MNIGGPSSCRSQSYAVSRLYGKDIHLLRRLRFVCLRQVRGKSAAHPRDEIGGGGADTEAAGGSSWVRTEHGPCKCSGPKSRPHHLAAERVAALAALGRELILRHSKQVLFRPAFKRVGQLLAAKRDLRLEAELKKFDRYDVLILDDIGYIQQTREEPSVVR